MGTYSEYLKNKGLTDPEKHESLETRVNAALDADEAVKAALERLKGFLDAYSRDREAEIDLAEKYLLREDEERKWGVRLWRDIQQLASTEKRLDGSQAHLLYDDLRVLLDRFGWKTKGRS